jgi:SAM-dependent methyltransferase
MNRIPFPPLRLRKSVGPIEDSYYDNQGGGLVFEQEVPAENYRSVFDFGCGCGRVARQLLLQSEVPVGSYLGVDLFSESVQWAQQNLTPANPAFQFRHHDIFNAQFNPSSEKEFATIEGPSRQFSLVTAESVFTHIIERNVENYLSECKRMLSFDGIFRASWFLFDKAGFPMMQESQNCLYINVDDPTNATIYDYNFVRSLYRKNGMTIFAIVPPAVRGFQWFLFAKPSKSGVDEAAFPDDVAPIGICRPPVNILEQL